MSKNILSKINNYINHKSETLVDRVYLAVLDKIFDAENNDEYEMDDDNNIYISYSLKKDELIITTAHEIIIKQIIRKYRKKLSDNLEEEGYFVEFEDTEIHVYFSTPIKLDSEDNKSESNINTYKKEPIVKAKLVKPEETFDFNGDD